MEFGERRGLAVVLPSQQNQMFQMESLKRQAKLAAEQKAKMFADDFDYTNAMNSHDNPLVKQFAMNKLMETGAFLRENPDWETDPFKRAKYKSLIHELKDNPDLNRGMLSDANYAAWQKWSLDPKNTSLVNSPWFKEKSNEWQNYLKFGNQKGEKAALEEGKKAFMFHAPEALVDVRGKALEIGSKLGTTTKLTNGPGFGASETFVDPLKINNEAINVFNGPERFSWDFTWDNMSNSEKTYYGNDKVKWAANLIKAGTDYKKTAGQYIYPQKEDGDENDNRSLGSSYSAYEHQIMRSPIWQVNNSPSLKHLTPLQNEDGNGNGFLNINEPLKMRTVGKDGKVVWRELNGFQNTNVPAYRTNDYMVDADGRVMMRFQAKVNLNSDNASQVRNMFDHNYWIQFAADPYDEIESYKNVARLEEDDKGNKTSHAIIDVWAPANTSDANKKLYDNDQLGISASNKAYPGMVANELLNKTHTRSELRQKYSDADIDDAISKGLKVID